LPFYVAAKTSWRLIIRETYQRQISGKWAETCRKAFRQEKLIRRRRFYGVSVFTQLTFSLSLFCFQYHRRPLIYILLCCIWIEKGLCHRTTRFNSSFGIMYHQIMFVRYIVVSARQGNIIIFFLINIIINFASQLLQHTYFIKVFIIIFDLLDSVFYSTYPAFCFCNKLKNNELCYIYATTKQYNVYLYYNISTFHYIIIYTLCV